MTSRVDSRQSRTSFVKFPFFLVSRRPLLPRHAIKPTTAPNDWQRPSCFLAHPRLKFNISPPPSHTNHSCYHCCFCSSEHNNNTYSRHRHQDLSTSTTTAVASCNKKPTQMKVGPIISLWYCRSKRSSGVTRSCESLLWHSSYTHY